MFKLINCNKNRDQNGYTLVEFLIVMGIILILVGIVVYVSNRVRDKVKVSQITTDATALYNDALSWIDAHPSKSAADLTMDKICTDATLCGTDTEQNNPWDVIYSITGSSLEITGVPGEVAQVVADGLTELCPSATTTAATTEADGKVTLPLEKSESE